jgi:hypothetical protein
MKEDKNLEQNLDNSNEKLHISDVMCCVCETPISRPEVMVYKDGKPCHYICFIEHNT